MLKLIPHCIFMYMLSAEKCFHFRVYNLSHIHTWYLFETKSWEQRTWGRLRDDQSGQWRCVRHHSAVSCLQQNTNIRKQSIDPSKPHKKWFILMSISPADQKVRIKFEFLCLFRWWMVVLPPRFLLFYPIQNDHWCPWLVTVKPPPQSWSQTCNV